MIAYENKMKYNTFTNISKVPNIIIMDYLFYNENIWKLLYYTADEKGNPIAKPLDMPNLTSKQKRNLIYQGIDDVTKCRVFLSNFPVEEEFSETVQQLRIFRDRILPSNSFLSNVAWSFELPCHNSIQTIIVDNTIMNRVDLLQEEIVKTLNGVHIGGIGTLMFSYDSPMRMSDRSDFFRFNRQFSGHIFTMSCNWNGSEGKC